VTDRERRLAAIEQRIERMPQADDAETDDDNRRRFGVLLGIDEPDPVRDADFDWPGAFARAERILGIAPPE
jgi:hypothetical protein